MGARGAGRGLCGACRRYYAKQSIANYAVHFVLTALKLDSVIERRIKQRTSKTSGMQMMSWDFGRPQRAS